MKLIIIFGPQAVGKMTVGHELEKITNLKLFHNHMTIELVSKFFNYGTDPGKRLVSLFRREIFKEAAESDLDGLIFTFVWAFNLKSDWEFIKDLKKIFRKKSEIYFVELEANEEERLKRNRTEHRLKHKPSKRNIEWSDNELIKTGLEHRLNSKDGEIEEKYYIKIDNTNIGPEDVAGLIKKEFGL